jgi:pimeloyl-ACP methyl ester carboxylesterase
VIDWLLLAAVLVLGVPAAAFLAQDRMLFLPHLAAAPPGGMHPTRPVEEIAFAVPDGPRVRGWLAAARGGGPAPLIVYYGGNAEDVTGQAFEPWPEDWALALVNYRGYGASEGRPSERALCADAEVVLDALARRPDVDPTRIVLAGRSLGTGVATHVAARRPVRGVVSHLALRQHGRPGPAPLPVPARALAPAAPVRLDRARARDQGAVARDRGRPRRGRPA